MVQTAKKTPAVASIKKTITNKKTAAAVPTTTETEVTVNKVERVKPRRAWERTVKIATDPIAKRHRAERATGLAEGTVQKDDKRSSTVAQRDHLANANMKFLQDSKRSVIQFSRSAELCREILAVVNPNAHFQRRALLILRTSGENMAVQRFQQANRIMVQHGGQLLQARHLQLRDAMRNDPFLDEVKIQREQTRIQAEVDKAPAAADERKAKKLLAVQRAAARAVEAAKLAATTAKAAAAPKTKKAVTTA